MECDNWSPLIRIRALRRLRNSCVSGYCQWILILLVTAEVAFHISCYNNGRRHIFPGDTFFLPPLRNDEYVPPIPVRIRDPYLKIEHSDRIDPKEHQKGSMRDRTWIPLIYPDEDTSPSREIYVHPLAYRERISITASSPIPVTDRPETFNIPLRKSIRVSNSGINKPSIQTTGYIKEATMKKIPVGRPTLKPKNTIIVDKETTAQSVTEVLAFDDNWKPKRITTTRPRVKEVKMTRKVNPIPFTRFSDSGTKDETPKISKTGDGNVRAKPDQTSDTGASYNKFANENTDVQNPYFQQPVIKSMDVSKTIKDPERKLQDSLSVNDNPPGYQKPYVKNGDMLSKTDSDIYTKLPDRKKLFIGVEYADSEIHGVKDNPSHVLNTNNKQTHTHHVASEEKLDTKDSNNDLRNNSQISPDVSVFNYNKTTESNAMKVDNYVKQNDQAQMLEPSTLGNHKTGRLDDRPNHETRTSLGSPKPTKPNSNRVIPPTQIISGTISFTESQKNKRPENSFNNDPFNPKLPFYSDIHSDNNNNGHSKDLKEDQIYFPQIFPNPLRTFETVNKTSNPTTTGKVLMDREKLIEFNTKQNKKDKNDIGRSSSHSNTQKTHYNPPKAVTTNDFSSHSYHSPTPPSLVTANSDIQDAFNPKKTGNKVNRTETYILQRKPSLFPDFPESNRPRKPNIKISSGMLAGILIAALIFLGFLTGTYLILVHS
ncbi:uncharacterized protein TNIN_424631 [Trichonephila inaurata madagascariensis]|uniref:Uncharacterized protein n=1 Tax=Trichonephila inaurata madagascariensis TaxID=2747483 RepID=A0A8X6ILK2_9ARAC|nr:uncharacterized protein TNIN_424631 [Trichonephila inaurata madagascariensis]